MTDRFGKCYLLTVSAGKDRSPAVIVSKGFVCKLFSYWVGICYSILDQ